LVSDWSSDVCSSDLTVLGAPEPCPRLLDGVERPASLSFYSAGRLLEDALRDAHFAHYAGG